MVQCMSIDIGARIREARLAAGLAQTKLAVAAGVNQATLSRWERGAIPVAEEIGAIASACGVSVQWIMTGAEEPTPATGTEG